MKKQITIRVFPDGRIESETHGIKGKDCLKYIKEIEQPWTQMQNLVFGPSTLVIGI